MFSLTNAIIILYCISNLQIKTTILLFKGEQQGDDKKGDFLDFFCLVHGKNLSDGRFKSGKSTYFGLLLSIFLQNV